MSINKLFQPVYGNYFGSFFCRVSGHPIAGGSVREYFKPYGSLKEFGYNALLPITSFTIHALLAVSAIPVALAGICGLAAGIATYGASKALKSDNIEQKAVKFSNYNTGLLFSGVVAFMIGLIGAFYLSALNLAALATGSFSTIKNALAKTNDAQEPVVNSPLV